MRKDFVVKRFKRNEIDDERWNKLIDEALLSKSYLYSWYLDVVSPNWQALILNDYEAVFVLPLKKKFGIKYLIQPNFVQQLGCISGNVNEEFLKYCIKYLKRHFLYYKINLNEIDTELLSIQKKSRIFINVSKKISGNETDSESYNNNTKRNIAKFYSAGLGIAEIEDYNPVINLFKKDKGSILSLNDSFYSLLIELLDEVKKYNKLVVCTAFNDDEIIAGTVFINTPKMSTFIFSGNSDYGKNYGAMHALIDYFIQKYLSEGQTLDFEGSINEGLAQFYMGFGGEKREYMQIFRRI
ncbi:MAG: aminoacyltransferase [Bacteroidales bacterium]|jgi:hypothetical protein|nr:aminoacyltransferase [Bacteroidales bacterium]